MKRDRLDMKRDRLDMKIYNKSFLVNAGDVTVHGICKISTLIHYVEIVTTEHISQMPILSILTESGENIGFFITNVWVKMHSKIQYGDWITVQTYQCPLKGAKIHRKIKFFVQNKLVAEAVTSLLLVNLDTRKLIRTTDFLCELDKSAYDDDEGNLATFGRMSCAKVKFIEKYKVRYSDIDHNGHMNNVRYAEIISDAMDLCMEQDKYISEMRIDFLSECNIGNEIELYMGGVDEIYVQGIVEKGKIKFRSSISLTEI